MTAAYFIRTLGGWFGNGIPSSPSSVLCKKKKNLNLIELYFSFASWNLITPRSQRRVPKILQIVYFLVKNKSLLWNRPCTSSGDSTGQGNLASNPLLKLIIMDCVSNKVFKHKVQNLLLSGTVVWGGKNTHGRGDKSQENPTCFLSCAWNRGFTHFQFLL